MDDMRARIKRADMHQERLDAIKVLFSYAALRLSVETNLLTLAGRL